jgi:hypothetical protein
MMTQCNGCAEQWDISAKSCETIVDYLKRIDKMGQYLAAPKVTVLRKEKFYKVVTSPCFNRMTKSGDEIAIHFDTISGSVNVGHRIVENDGDGLSVKLPWNSKDLPATVIFFATLARGDEKNETEGAIVPRASS